MTHVHEIGSLEDVSPTLYALARSVLFRLNPESAHVLTLKGLEIADTLGLAGLIGGTPPRKPVSVMGLKFPNPVGLAAGMDKDAECPNAFAKLGFGFVELGTFTPRPQPGNDKPRLFRLIDHSAIINRMGFNNHGIDAAVARIQKMKRPEAILGINIGKNKITPNENATEDYLYCLRAAWPVADYIAVNLSSPNTPGLRALQEADTAAKLLEKLKNEQSKLQSETGRRVPLVFKVAPDLADSDISALGKVFKNGGLDGMIATNTTIDRAAVKDHPRAKEAGGLSGKPLTKRSTEVIAAFASELSGALPIIGVGGIMTGEDAAEKFAAGASLVQLYTGFIYKGPALIRDCVTAAPDSSGN